MQVIVEYKGKTYISARTDEDPKEMSNKFYAVSPLKRFHMELEDGSFLVMGEKAASSAVLIFKQ